jgi:hypothetical protein
MTIDSTITLERMEVSQRRLLPLFLLALLLLALAAACGYWAYSYREGWKPYMASGLFSFWGLSCVLMSGNSSARFDKRTHRAEIRRSCLCGLIQWRNHLRLNEVGEIVVRRKSVHLDKEGKEIQLWSASLRMESSGRAITLFWSPSAKPVLDHALLLAVFLCVPMVGEA